MSDLTNSASETKMWERRVFWTVWTTYFAFYLCRYNMPVAKSTLCDTYSWTAKDFGWVFSALTAAYAVGQFVNGQLADRFGSRAVASLGILVSVTINLAVFVLLMLAPPEAADPKFVLNMLILFWAINGFFQSMGWPSMVRLMAHWVSTKRRGKVMGALGTCYLFGNAFTWCVAMLLTGYFVDRLGGDWRNVFLVPAVMFAFVGMAFFFVIRNRPEDVGLPPINVELGASGETAATSRPSIAQNVITTLRNPYLWIVAGAFFMLDVTRYGFVNWLPDYIKSQDLGESTALMANLKPIIKVCILPLGGVPGMLLAGWATDKFFGGRRAPVIVVMLAMLGIMSIVFPFVDTNNTWLIMVVIAMIGFCTYGPHILMVGHAAQDFGKKAGAGGAAGFIDAMGYVGATLTGVGAGHLIDTRGYQITFVTFGSAALIGALLACFIWKVGPSTDEAEAEG